MSETTYSVKLYFSVFVALIFLTGLTAGIAYIDLGPLNTVVALTIAVIKGLLVALFFMHLRHGDHLTWVFAGAGLLWLFFLIGLTLSDVLSRGWLGPAGP